MMQPERRATEDTMLVSLLLSSIHTALVRRRYHWQPDVDLSDTQILNTLMPGAHS
jgi:hypothetical protein